jgi:hypothetical protein
MRVEVAVHADQPVAVIDEDRLAVEKVVADRQHLARARWRLIGVPAADGEVES